MIGIFIAKAIPIIIGIFVFGLLIFVHELGHFAAARRCGIFVEEFAMGMGPKLLSVTRNGTVYSLRAFPMGGFCKMLGDETEENDPRAFNSKSVGKRMVVILAGAFMNMLLAFVLFTVVVFTNYLPTTTISAVIPGLPADAAGIEPHDKITAIGSSKIHIYDDMIMALQNGGGGAVSVELLRDGEKNTKTITPAYDGGRYIIGIHPVRKTGFFSAAEEGVDKAGFAESLSESYWEMLFWVKMTYNGLWGLLTRSIPVNDISGPLGVVSVISETYEKTAQVPVWLRISQLMQFAGLLSASIGIFNLLPIPALDGGRFIFLALEAVRRKPVPPEKEGLIHFIGFVALIALGIFVAYNDIMKIIARMMSS